jgi:multidrug efflux pump subunit AcrA (membrane-fusion protein)
MMAQLLYIALGLGVGLSVAGAVGTLALLRWTRKSEENVPEASKLSDNEVQTGEIEDSVSEHRLSSLELDKPTDTDPMQAKARYEESLRQLARAQFRADEQLRDAEAALEDARREADEQLRDTDEQLRDAEAALEDARREADEQLRDVEAALEDARREAQAAARMAAEAHAEVVAEARERVFETVLQYDESGNWHHYIPQTDEPEPQLTQEDLDRWLNESRYDQQPA